MGYNINGQKTVAFLDHTTVYPIKIDTGAHALAIVNPSDTSITFTITTQKGITLTSVVPPSSSYNGLFDTIDTVSIIGALEFYAELRL